MQNTIHRSIQFCLGGSTGFTFASLLDLVNFQTIGSGVAFVGSAAFTAFSWWLSRKSELLRLERELDGDRRDAEREEQVKSLIHEIRMSKLRHDAEMDAHEPGPVS